MHTVIIVEDEVEVAHFVELAAQYLFCELLPYIQPHIQPYVGTV